MKRKKIFSNNPHRPPGTGKSKVICSIISEHLTNSTRDYPSILVCAHSNTAVYVIVSRLKNGVANSTGKNISPKILRVGDIDRIDKAVFECTLEGKLDKKLRREEIEKLKDEVQGCLTKKRKKRRPKRSKMKETREGLLHSFYSILFGSPTKESHPDDEREKEAYKRKEKIKEIELRIKMRNERIKEIVCTSEVILSTMSSSAGSSLSSLETPFDLVIMDEATQAVEPSSLIPHTRPNGVSERTRCILVGDPKQLPPTIFSDSSKQENYGQSHFCRIINVKKNSSHFLDTQYRMHSEISAFPNAEFYGCKIKNEAEFDPQVLAPYKVYDIASQEELCPDTNSYFNKKEADYVCALFEFLHWFLDNPTAVPATLGIIAPYRRQVSYLQDAFAAKFKPDRLKNVPFGTVDSFQGQEKDFVIFSCVRAQSKGEKSKKMGFLSDRRRLNVALTRAKRLM